MTEKCRLCQQPNSLLQSHVLSEFLYAGLYDDKHRHIGVTPHAELRNEFEQKGLRERLLCQECEKRLSDWESHAATVLCRIPDTAVARPGDVLEIPDVNYTKFKLFQLSLIWRCSVAKAPEFEEVDLGVHQDQIRKLLLGNDPGSRADYGCILIGFRRGKADKLMRPPIPHRLRGHRSYVLLAGGLLWLFVISSRAAALGCRESFLGEGGVLRIHIGSETAEQFTTDILASLRQLKLI